jgi:hypothetical protein
MDNATPFILENVPAYNLYISPSRKVCRYLQSFVCLSATGAGKIEHLLNKPGNNSTQSMKLRFIYQCRVVLFLYTLHRISLGRNTWKNLKFASLYVIQTGNLYLRRRENLKPHLIMKLV